jgi:hypothetical protein
LKLNDYEIVAFVVDFVGVKRILIKISIRWQKSIRFNLLKPFRNFKTIWYNIINLARKYQKYITIKVENI